MRLQVLLVVLSVTLRSGGGERGGMAGRRRSKDGSLQFLSAETRGPQSSSNRPFESHGPNANGAIEKIPSPLPFPTRLPKNGHNIVFLPGGSATALNNGRDLMTVPRAPGVGINFGAEKNGQDGTTNTVPRTTPKPPPVTTAPAPVTGNVDSGAGAGGSGTVYRRRSSPGCTRGSKALPCEVDDEYTDEIADRISHLLYASRMNAIIDDATFSQFLNDTAVVDDGKTFDLPTTRSELNL
ncbi:uncharacterized protein LOC108666638 [Hyalella azteca]|uniref:Uncharacterized protein LOC108666638 n=1 Tax=Hyalella azteca TaxID=294128 RepID=A0A8B7N6Z0_HYAAZ|nr:uncharacterized protein LOC108666638 [Hyalella azteca]